MHSRENSADAGVGAMAWLWPGLLIVAATLGSWALACVMPFAALALVAAATLSPRHALLATVAAWLVNQAVGYLVLDYPAAASSLAWGAAIGVAALLGCAAAIGALRGLVGRPAALRLGVGLLAAFAAYEATLYATSFVLGGQEAFSLEIVSQVAGINVLWAAGLGAAFVLLQAWQGRRALIGPDARLLRS